MARFAVRVAPAPQRSHPAHDLVLGIGRVAGDAVPVGHAAQPGQLAFGQLARGGNAAGVQGLELLARQVRRRALARARRACGLLQRMPALAVADAAHGRQIRVQIGTLHQHPDFAQQALGEHLLKPGRDALMQPGAICGLQRDHFNGQLRRALSALVKRRQRPATDLPDLERACDALAVARRQASCGDRVDFGQLGMQGRPADLGRLTGNVFAHLGVRRRHVVQTVDQGLEIQHGAAHQQRLPAPLSDLLNQDQRIASKLRGAVGLAWVADINQVVGHGRQFVGCGLGRAHIHAPVDQGRIHADDFHRPALSQGQGGCGFPRGGRAGEGDQGAWRAGLFGFKRTSHAGGAGKAKHLAHLRASA